MSELLTQGAQHLARNMTSKAFLGATRPSFCALVLKQTIVSREIIRLTGSSSLEEVNITNITNITIITNTTNIIRNLLAQKAQPLRWDDSGGIPKGFTKTKAHPRADGYIYSG